MTDAPLGWFGIVRLGLVQTALGAIVVLTTSTFNRVMVVDIGLAAIVPGLLVFSHYAVQATRPRWGHGSDVGGRVTPWIVGGLAVLAVGGVGASVATAWMTVDKTAGILLAVVSYLLIGAGVGAAGTCLLALLAKRVEPDRRAAAATIVWIMMIAGFAVTTGVAGHYLKPFSPERLIMVTAVVAALAFVVATLAVQGIEGRGAASRGQNDAGARGQAGFQAGFMAAVAEVWADPAMRRFAIFVFVAMLAFKTQDLILEPFAGVVFGMTVGESTQLSGVHNGGMLAGMIAVAIASRVRWLNWLSLPAWTIGGCIASGLALAAIALSGFGAPDWRFYTAVSALGFANGAFAIAAIGSMMTLAGAGRSGREGVRMGVFGAAQAFAFGLGDLLGPGSSDIARAFISSPAAAYATVFAAEGVLFLVAAYLAVRVFRQGAGAALSARTLSPA